MDPCYSDALGPWSCGGIPPYLVLHSVLYEKSFYCSVQFLYYLFLLFRRIFLLCWKLSLSTRDRRIFQTILPIPIQPSIQPLWSPFQGLPRFSKVCVLLFRKSPSGLPSRHLAIPISPPSYGCSKVGSLPSMLSSATRGTLLQWSSRLSTRPQRPI